MSGQFATEQSTGPLTESLRVYLMGPPGVEWACRPLAIPRRQARALLYRLAARLQLIPREQLCLLLWPDTPESTARRNLSHLLTHLRYALPAPEVLQTSGDRVGLDPQRTWSDVVAFERLCAVLPPTPPAPLPLSQPFGFAQGRLWERGVQGGEGEGEALRQAVNLYRGPFLSGFSLPDCPEFETWVVQERQCWERLYLAALAALVGELTARRQFDAAIAYTQHYLATDDLAEDMHRRLIELYAAVGDRCAALRHFERCTAVLERELGVSPLPETRAVYQAVLEGRPPPLLHAVPSPAWTTLRSLHVPLVGRDDVLRRLERAYAQARAGHGKLILISGEPGIGKSRLIQEFATRLQSQALVLAGSGHPGGQTLPYQPIVEAFRSMLNARRTTLNVQSPWLAEASRLLPELRTRHPNLPPPMPAEPDEARARLFEALCQLTLGLATGAYPVLLCLDDLHWADRVTLDWLAYVGRQLRHSRLLIIGSYRSEEADVVAELRHGLARLGVLSELKLAGLDTGAVLQLVHHLAGAMPGDKALADRLQKTTGGNPFFVLETLQALVEAGRLLGDLPGPEGQPQRATPAQDLPLPDTVRQAVEARLQRLSPMARQVLEAAAVLGATFDFELVRATAGRRELETMDGLDELCARQLLMEQSTERLEVHLYQFQHELVQRVVELNLSPMRRQLLHRRAGRALEQLEPDTVAALAHHFDAGGEAQRALHYHGLAAQRAEALCAWQEAEKHHGRMLELLERLDPACTRPDCLARRGQVLVARAHLRFLQSRLAERDADLAALTALAETSGNEPLRLQALIHRVRYLNLDARYENAIAVAEEGLALADRLGDTSARCRLLAQIGFAHYFLGQPRPALVALESALAVAGEEADPEMRGRITHILGYVYFHLGDYARSLVYQQEAYACHQKVGDYNRVAWDGLDIGAVHLEMGRFAEARQYLTENLALARQIGARPAEAYGLALSGCWELYRGDYVAAADHFHQSLAMQRDLRSEHGRVAAEAGTGLAFYHLGDLAQARHWLERTVRRARSIGHRRRLVEALIGLGLVQVADGQPSVAQRWLAEAVEVACESDCREGLAAGLAALARAERHGDDPANALSHACEAVRVARESTLSACEMWGEAEIGLTLLVRGEFAAALEHTARGVALVAQAHEGWIATEQVHLAHARVLRALGQTEAAKEQTRLAEAIVETKAGRIPDPELRRRYLESRL
jgi:DNA-binding SARP family transcriptional activator/tetratricopeptide (TPR) repeat protein